MLRNSVADALEHRRFFVLLPSVVIAGMTGSLLTSGPPEPLALAAVMGLLLATLPFVSRSLPAFRLVLLLATFWAGFSLLTAQGMFVGTPMLRYPAFGIYQARIDDVLSRSDEGQRLLISAVVPVDGARALPIRRARLTAPAGAELASGDTIRGPIRFYAVPGPVLPNGYDGQFSGYFDGIGAYATATAALERVATGDPSAPARVIASIREGIAARLDAILAQPAAGIARAIITGDQSAVTDEVRETMATAGIAHVLSVSGLHLTLVAGGVFVALRLLFSVSELLALRFPVKRIAAAMGVLAALLYFAISGGNVAAVRATIMIVLVFGAVIFGRRALTMRNVAIAALIVLATDPASVFMPSFQLSFAAVVALIGAWELSRREPNRDISPAMRIVGYFGGIAATSVVAGAATLLFSAYHFQQTSPLGVLGNLVSLPLVGFVMMPAAFLAVLVMPFGLEAPLLSAVGWSVDRMIDLARMVTSISSGIDASPNLTPASLFIGLVALAWFSFLRDRWRLLGPALALPAVLLVGLDRAPDVLIADTTQAVAVRGPQGLWLVDGKPGTFAVSVWEETYGGRIAPADPSDLRCDSLGCLTSGEGGFSIALARDPAALYEDCGTVDLVITRLRAPASCGSGTVIDADDLHPGGAHWLRWDPATRKFEVRPAITDLNRPWRVARQ